MKRFLPSTCTTTDAGHQDRAPRQHPGPRPLKSSPDQGVHAIDGDGRFPYSTRRPSTRHWRPEIRRVHGEAVERLRNGEAAQSTAPFVGGGAHGARRAVEMRLCTSSFASLRAVSEHASASSMKPGKLLTTKSKSTFSVLSTPAANGDGVPCARARPVCTPPRPTTFMSVSATVSRLRARHCKGVRTNAPKGWLFVGARATRSAPLTEAPQTRDRRWPC